MDETLCAWGLPPDIRDGTAMKIALCLSGQMRAMRHCIHQVNLAFPNCDIDVYASTWDTETEENEKILKDKVNVVSFERYNNKDLNKYSELEQEAIIRGFEGIKRVENWAPVPVWNLTRIELLAQNSYYAVQGEYDYIVRSRFDMTYLEDLTPLLSREQILLSEDIGGSAPWDIWKGSRMVFDGFAAGSPAQMEEYYRFVDWLPLYFTYHDETLKAERTLGWYLDRVAAVDTKFARDIVGIQINETEWYNRSNPIRTDSLSSKQKGTFDFYKQDLKNNYPDLYETIEHVFK